MMADQEERVEQILQHLHVNTSTLDRTVRDRARRRLFRPLHCNNVPLLTKVVKNVLGIRQAEIW